MIEANDNLESDTRLLALLERAMKLTRTPHLLPSPVTHSRLGGIQAVVTCGVERAVSLI